MLGLDERRARAQPISSAPNDIRHRVRQNRGTGQLGAGFGRSRSPGEDNKSFGVYELYKWREELRSLREAADDRQWNYRLQRFGNEPQVSPSLISAARSALSKRRRTMWVDRNGRPVSPPSNHPRSPTFRKVIVSVEDGLSLGLMIRGGNEYGLGIYVTGVDEASAADLAGLQFGDQIISVNDLDFTHITHDEAVTLLQSSPRMQMVVRGEGKVPHSTLPPYTANPDNAAPSTSADSWYEPHRSQLSRKGSPRKRDIKMEEVLSSNPNAAERRLDRKARQLLSESQRLSLSFYCNEYETGAMGVEDFVKVLLQMLDSQEKYSLMSDIRALVPSGDLGKFDELIYRREIQVMKNKEAMKLAVEIHTEHADGNNSPPGEILRGLSPRSTFRVGSTRRRQLQDKHHLTVPIGDHPDDMHTPSEDSGVDLPNGAIFGHGSRKGSRVSTGSRDSMTLDTKSLQRKPSPSRLWRTSPRTSRRSLDAMTTSQTTRMRRTTFRRHSSGGEGGHSEDRGPRYWSHEDRRWSIGSEGVDAPYVEGHLDAARAVLSRLKAIALTQRRRSPVSPRSPRSPRSPISRSPLPRSPVSRSPVRSPRLSPVPMLSPSDSLQIPHIKVRRHRSLPDPHAIQARKKQQQLEKKYHSQNLGLIQLQKSASVRLQRGLVSGEVPEPRLSPVPMLSPSDSLQIPHIKVRRHRSLPDPHAIQARKKQQQLEKMQQQRSASVRLPGHRTIPEGNGRFRIIVKKTRPLLGIAIEGGADTTQPLPRIISIHNSGAAFDAGGLKVGHIILEVDGIKMSRRPHREVAQLIAHAFYGTDKDQVEFVVIETSRNMESEGRRTSIMVLQEMNEKNIQEPYCP